VTSARPAQPLTARPFWRRRLLLAALALAVALTLDACDPAGESPDADVIPGDAATTDDAPPGPTLEVSATVAVPNPGAGLSYEVSFRSSAPAVGRVQVACEGEPPRVVTAAAPTPAISHRVWVLGLPAGRDVRLTAVAEAGGARALGEPVTVHTEPVPATLPTVTLDLRRPDVARAGYTLFGAFDFGAAGASAGAPPNLVAVDATGRVAWYYLPGDDLDWGSGRGLVLAPNQHVLAVGGFGLVELDLRGHAVGRIEASTLGVAALHHDALRLPDGNYVSIAVRLAAMPGVAFSDAAALVDEVVEFTPDGTVVHRWPLDAYVPLDTAGLDLARATVDPAFPGIRVVDAFHANSLTYSAADGTLLVGLFFQGLLLQFRRQTGELVASYGRTGSAALDAGGSWFVGSHGPELGPDGLLLVYDNGFANDGGLPRPCRVVAYQLGQGPDGAPTARQAWQHRSTFLSPILGNVQRLSNGRVLACHGSHLQSASPLRTRPTIDELTPDGTDVIATQTVERGPADPGTTPLVIFRAYHLDDLQVGWSE
jgi:hypothetical protein